MNKIKTLIYRDELIGSIQYAFDGLAESWVQASEFVIEIIREEPEVPQMEYTEQDVRDAFNSGYACGKDGYESGWNDCLDKIGGCRR